MIVVLEIFFLGLFRLDGRDVDRRPLSVLLSALHFISDPTGILTRLFAYQGEQENAEKEDKERAGDARNVLKRTKRKTRSLFLPKNKNDSDNSFLASTEAEWWQLQMEKFLHSTLLLSSYF